MFSSSTLIYLRQFMPAPPPLRRSVSSFPSCSQALLHSIEGSLGLCAPPPLSVMYPAVFPKPRAAAPLPQQKSQKVSYEIDHDRKKAANEKRLQESHRR